VSRPRLLDLFCGAGGAAVGYHRAGFDIVGVDIHPQPRYPYEFHQADAMTWPLDGYDAIHASPPCQLYSISTVMHDRSQYPDLLDATRTRLMATGAVYVIENVPGAPLRNWVQVCGSGLGMVRIRRHRRFRIQRGPVGRAMCPRPEPRGA
jgi:DNA (cytosine-5)-methyltransferase 1